MLSNALRASADAAFFEEVYGDHRAVTFRVLGRLREGSRFAKAPVKRSSCQEELLREPSSQAVSQDEEWTWFNERLESMFLRALGRS